MRMLLFSRMLLTIAVTTMKIAIVFHPYLLPPWINAKGNSRGVMRPGIMRLPIDTLLPVPREHSLSASDCGLEPSRSCLLGFTRHAGDIQPHANLSYPTSPDICEDPVEKSRICNRSYAVTSLEDVTLVVVSGWRGSDPMD